MIKIIPVRMTIITEQKLKIPEECTILNVRVGDPSIYMDILVNEDRFNSNKSYRTFKMYGVGDELEDPKNEYFVTKFESVVGWLYVFEKLDDPLQNTLC